MHVNSVTSKLYRSWTQLAALWCSKIVQQPPPVHTPPAFVLVEGPNDMAFLKRISVILHHDDPTIPDLISLETDGRIVFIPFGGSDVRFWTFRLASTRSREFHLYDHEISPETEVREHVVYAVNQRPGCRAFLQSVAQLGKVFQSGNPAP